MTVACGGNPAAPSARPPVVVAACVSQNTATLTIANDSAINATYTISIDGVAKPPLGPGQSGSSTVVAGVAHTVVFRYTNTNVLACNSASPILVQCSTFTTTCRG